MDSKDWIKGLYRDNFENVISKSKKKKWKNNISMQIKIRIIQKMIEWKHLYVDNAYAWICVDV